MKLCWLDLLKHSTQRMSNNNSMKFSRERNWSKFIIIQQYDRERKKNSNEYWNWKTKRKLLRKHIHFIIYKWNNERLIYLIYFVVNFCICFFFVRFVLKINIYRIFILIIIIIMNQIGHHVFTINMCICTPFLWIGNIVYIFKKVHID